MVVLAVAADCGLCILPGSRENPFSDRKTCFEVSTALAWSDAAGDKVEFVLGKGTWLSAWILLSLESFILHFCPPKNKGKGLG